MWHYFLVKTYDLKNQSLQQDYLSCLSHCSTGKKKYGQSVVFAGHPCCFNKQYIQHASTRNFIFIVRLCDNPFSFGVFFFAVHLFLLAQWLPLCNYARHIGQKLKESIKSADLSGSTVRHSRLWVLRHHFPELTLLSVSLYCCTKSPIMSSVYPFGLCHSDLSKRYSIFLLALFKMKFIMDRVVSCTVVLASCWDRRYLEKYMTEYCTFSVFCGTAVTALMNFTYTEALCEEGLVTDRRKRYHFNHGEQARERDDIRSLEDCGNLWLGLVDLTYEFK